MVARIERRKRLPTWAGAAEGRDPSTDDAMRFQDVLMVFNGRNVKLVGASCENAGWCVLNSGVKIMNSEIRTCAKCNGTGKIVIGYGAICTEVVEKVKKCPECNGTGHIVQIVK